MSNHEDGSGESGGSEGRRVGPWRLVREIGRGGMAVVFLAQRADGQFDQRAALKLVKRGLDSEEVLARFRRERQILARLQHPHIARLLDGGRSEDGSPYFAMEHVEGRALVAYCDERRPGVEDRLRLFLKVCRAVQYAHVNLVVHRDLKPSNILVTAEGEPKLLDFGIARLLDDQPEAGQAEITRTGLRVLTPAYAAPEQVRGDPVTTATDVHALGLILYELLAGRHPFADRLGTPLEAERAVLEREPPPPSALRHAPRASQRRLAGDLDTIVLMALRKEPGRRYASVAALAEDVERHLAGWPVLARRGSRAYRAGKFISRHRVMMAAASLAATALLLGLAASFWQARTADREARKAGQARDFLVSLFDIARPEGEGRREITAQEILDRGALRIQKELEDQPEIRTELLTVVGEVYNNLGLYDRAVAVLEPAVVSRRRLASRADLATTLRALGMTRMGRAEWEAAEQALREAIQAGREAWGPESPEVARMQISLARILKERGRYEEADQLLRTSVSTLRRRLGSDHPDVARGLDALGSLLHWRGSYEEAESAFREAVVVLRRGPQAESLQMAATLSGLGALLGDRGSLDEAAAVITEALVTQRKILGETHPDVATTLHDLASVKQSQGDYEAAGSLYGQVVAIYRQRLGPDHAWLATSLHDLAKLKMAQGDPAAAEPLLREALEIYRKALGADHEFTAMALASLANVRVARGDVASAQPMLESALAIYRRRFPEGHPVTGTVLVALGHLLTERGQAGEAEPLLREALESWRAAFGPDDRRIADAQVKLGACLAEEGRYEEAESFLLAAHAVLPGAKGKGGAGTALQAVEQLVSLYERWGRKSDAARYRALLATINAPPR